MPTGAGVDRLMFWCSAKTGKNKENDEDRNGLMKLACTTVPS